MSLQDVARRARVSAATVSRVLNNIGTVRSSTRSRVLKAIEDLKYYPNAHAQALAGGASRTLGLIVSNLENPFFLDIFRVLEQEAHSHGYEVLIANTDYDSQWLKSSVRIMLGRRVAGLALIVSEIDPAILDELESRQVRTVVYDVGEPRPGIQSIKANYRKGIERAAEYLRSLGHRKFAFVGHHTGLGPLGDRKRTFIEVMERYSPALQFITVADSDDYAGGRRAVRQLFASKFRPTAILCVNDFMAVGVLRELREMGMEVPGHVSVTGFDNISLSEVVYPALTTLHIARDQIGRQIFANLSATEHPFLAPQEIVISPELVIRESTGRVPDRAS
ncbi:MAG TPA: LacI family DNA-binding transcriptional regulator [Bryobacteraceae bacterium]|nr:LacI family DNA-binding transcriptional regulator [Bryobacteraceae bacterium]